MKILFVISISMLLASSAFGQVEKKDTTNSLLFKSFEQKNGFSRTGLSFNYFASTLGFSFDFFINRSFSVDVAIDGVYGFDAYYTGRAASVKYWPKRIRSTNKLYPFLGVGLSEGKGYEHLIKSRDYLHFPVGVRYFFSSGFQVSYHLNISPALFDRNENFYYLYTTLTCFTFGVGWRF